MHRIKAASDCYVNQISFSEDSRHMLCSCSDKEMRLLFIDFDNMNKRHGPFKAAFEEKKTDEKTIDQIFGNLGRKSVYQRNEFKDVINGRKW